MPGISASRSCRCRERRARAAARSRAGPRVGVARPWRTARRPAPPRPCGRHTSRRRAAPSRRRRRGQWVIRMMAAPVLALSSRIRSRICAWIGDVERRGRLVGDQQLAGRRRAPWRSSRAGACRRRAGADIARCAAPAPGMRTRRSISTARASAASRDQALVQRQRLGDLPADGQHRVERGHRLLEDHRDLVAAHRRASRARTASSRSRALEADACPRRCGPAARRSGAGSTAR